jgi:anti-sigma B factor antagonist
MEIKAQQQGKSVIFSLAGVMDERGAALLKDQFEAISLHNLEDIILDCGVVTFIGSAGIGKLLVIYNRVAKNNIKIKLVNLRKDILDNFKSMKLDQLFNLT